MDGTLALSIVLGLGLAAANGIASIVVLRRAAELPMASFIRRVFGSLGLRMFVLFIVVALILWQVQVHPLGFAFAFIGGLVIALVVEMWIVLKWARSQT